MKRLLIILIKGYRYIVSPLLGQNCRFHPTCSQYAIQAIEKHGVLRGGYMAVYRILKCHPWYQGKMIDPVPEKTQKH